MRTPIALAATRSYSSGRLPGALLLAGALLLGGCWAMPPAKVECPPQGTTLTWEGFGHPFVSTYCFECHAEKNQGPIRQGAPVGMDYDTHAKVTARTQKILSRLHEMPPGARRKPTESEYAQMREWLACGTP